MEWQGSELPVLGNPGRGTHVMVNLGTVKAPDGFIGIGPAVKDEDCAFRWRLWGGYKVAGKHGAAVVFVAAGPGFRPPIDFLHGIS